MRKDCVARLSKQRAKWDTLVAGQGAMSAANGNPCHSCRAWVRTIGGCKFWLKKLQVSIRKKLRTFLVNSQKL